MKAADLKDGHVKFRIDHFVRFLAKIAHGYAVAKAGDLLTPLLLPIIHGDLTKQYDLIGGNGKELPARDFLWQVAPTVSVIAGRIYMVVSIRLFAFLGAPVYQVVAGEITGEYSGLLPDHLRAPT